MLRSFCFIIAVVFLTSFHQPFILDDSPLAGFSAEWQKPEYLKCNTAKNTAYLTQPEKKLIWILNMVRNNPPLFAQTVLKKYPDSINKPWIKNIAEYKSLLTTLEKTKKLSLLNPDSLGWISAKCHAATSGLAGYVGHERQDNTCKTTFYAECCDYGSDDPLDIIMNLLIDEGVPSLGHRNILLSNVYKKAGVSIQPHKVYQYTAVLDFYY